MGTCGHGATPPCPYCAALVIADDGPDLDDRPIDYPEENRS